MTTHWLMSDYFLWGLALMLLCLIFRKRQHGAGAWQQLCQHKITIVSMVLLGCFSCIALLDSWHFVNQQSQTISALDRLLPEQTRIVEKSYTAPFATQAFQARFKRDSTGRLQQFYTANQQPPPTGMSPWWALLQGGVTGGLICLGIAALIMALVCIHKRRLAMPSISDATRVTALSMAALIIVFSALLNAEHFYHILGTNQVGQDILLLSLKSIRTGMIIGSLSTLLMLPFAIFLGLLAGYFRGWVDDAIQYLYTTLSAIPGVLLISATILVMQIYIEQHPGLFSTLTQRADARLLALCAILGLTSWATLCRLIRAETLKIRATDFVSVAEVLGLARWRILCRHILPNLGHIILITIALDFSGLVLAEAVLSYVGVGVDPSTPSWGNLINSARLELAREPIVWWPLLAAFVMMFLLVLSANLFADALRDALDPRTRLKS